MVEFVLIYVCILTFYAYNRHKRIDLATGISIVYLISLVFSVVMFNDSLLRNQYGDFSLEASIVFCLLFTLNLTPFISHSNLYIRRVKPIANNKMLDYIVYIGFTFLIISIIGSINTVVMILTGGNILELRQEMYRGESDLGMSYAFVPSFLMPLITLLNMIYGNNIIFIFLFFCSLAFFNKSKKYNILILCISLLGPLQGIVGVDRSKMAYWIITFVICFFLFKNYMNKENLKFVKKMSIPFVVLAVLYLGLVTVSRFETSDAGSGGSLVEYLGQPFPNFANFYDDFEPTFFSLQRIFPLTYRFILGSEYQGATDFNAYMSFMSGTEIGVFATYLGDIITGSGKLVSILFALAFSIISFSSTRKMRRGYVTIFDLYIFFILGSVMFCGIFLHYYNGYPRMFSSIFFAVYFKLMCNSKNNIKNF